MDKASRRPIPLISEEEEEGEEAIVGKEGLDQEAGPSTKKSKGVRQVKEETKVTRSELQDL